MNSQNINDINFLHQKVLVRVDFNLPLDEKGNISDLTRIHACIPTIQKIIKSGGTCILISHFGRPKQRENQYSLKFLVPLLSTFLEKEVLFISDFLDPAAANLIRKASDGSVFLLENIRFYPQEEAAEELFAEKLAQLGTIFIHEAFSTAHRAHASTALLTKYIDRVAAGYLMQSEIEHLSVLFNAPHPFVAVVGGAKISSKIDTIYAFLDIADVLLIGGAMASTFILAQAEIEGESAQIGNSLIERTYISVAKTILESAVKKNKPIILPKYSLIADSFSESAKYKIAPSKQIPVGWMALDIAPESYPDYALYLEKAKTIVWNGPMGVFEWANFAKGTAYIAETIAKLTQKGTYSVVGGGDSIAALKQFDLQDKMSYISTGGGAMLEFIEKKGALPGILALNSSFKIIKHETI